MSLSEGKFFFKINVGTFARGKRGLSSFTICLSLLSDAKEIEKKN